MRRNTLIVIGLASIATVSSALGQASSADKRLALTIYNSTSRSSSTSGH